MPSMKSAGLHQRNRAASRSRKHTAWKKNRRFGQSYGGDAVYRSPLYLPYTRLPALLPSEVGPLLVENRPHRDFFFPVTGGEVMDRIAELPSADTEGLTHVWMRHMRPKDRRPFGVYCTGPGYRAIVLYPWPRDLRLALGRQPSAYWKKFAAQYDAKLSRSRGHWHATFTLEASRRFYLDDLILHEVGHHADWRRFSAANDKQAEDFADGYAATWARRLNRAQPTSPSRRQGMSSEAQLRLEAMIRLAYPQWNALFGAPDEVGPHPSLTVSFRLVDRQGRDRSNTVWIRPSAIAGLTVDGMKARVERANAGWKRPLWKGSQGKGSCDERVGGNNDAK